MNIDFQKFSGGHTPGPSPIGSGGGARGDLARRPADLEVTWLLHCAGAATGGIEGGRKGDNGELGCTNKPPWLKILSAGAEVARTQKVYSSSATDSSHI